MALKAMVAHAALPCLLQLAVPMSASVVRAPPQTLARTERTRIPMGQSEFYIEQAWRQPEDVSPVRRNRTVHCIAVRGKHRLRPVIYLHGLGGNGSSIVSNHELNPLHDPGTLVLAPDGYLNSWDAVVEKSQAPDVEFVEKIVGRLGGYSNVDMSDGVTVIGYSNGCNLVHRIAVESNDTLIKRLGCSGTSLNHAFYRHGEFFHRADDSDRPPSPQFVYGFTHKAKPLMGRTLWVFHGKKDDVIPFDGGEALGRTVKFKGVVASTHIWAKYYGNNTAGRMVEHKCNGYNIGSYLNGQVAMFAWDEGGHGIKAPEIRKHLRDLERRKEPAIPTCKHEAAVPVTALTRPAPFPPRSDIRIETTMHSAAAPSKGAGIAFAVLHALAPLLLAPRG